MKPTMKDTLAFMAYCEENRGRVQDEVGAVMGYMREPVNPLLVARKMVESMEMPQLLLKDLCEEAGVEYTFGGKLTEAEIEQIKAQANARRLTITEARLPESLERMTAPEPAQEAPKDAPHGAGIVIGLVVCAAIWFVVWFSVYGWRML